MAQWKKETQEKYTIYSEPMISDKYRATIELQFPPKYLVTIDRIPRYATDNTPDLHNYTTKLYEKYFSTETIWEAQKCAENALKWYTNKHPLRDKLRRHMATVLLAPRTST